MGHDKTGHAVGVVHQIYSCARLQVPQPNAAIIMTCKNVNAFDISQSSHD